MDHRPRRAEFAELRDLVERQLRGPIADHVRTQITQATTRLGRWNSPAAKLERRRRRLAALMWVFLFLGMIIAVVAAAGIATAPGVGDAILSGITAVLALAAFTVSGRAGLRLRALNRTALPAAAEPAVSALPARSSQAREPMERLQDAERVLADLLRQLSSPRSSVPKDTVDHARATGAEAAGALREVAAQLQSVERARDIAPAHERGPLADGVRRLREQLDQGLDGYGSLIAAAGRLVAASSTGGPDKQALTDASDRLHGLAVALRELFPERG
ncbi:hypothetical protein [Actinocrispum sp. NPDC049592]|uniref:phage shock envelope stress response protein PspM n=1 Tax=Actinocrispum sp. NPDC049592 TaxID=3154835 RepID=UPI00343C8EE4